MLRGWDMFMKTAVNAIRYQLTPETIGMVEGFVLIG